MRITLTPDEEDRLVGKLETIGAVAHTITLEHVRRMLADPDFRARFATRDTLYTFDGRSMTAEEVYQAALEGDADSLAMLRWAVAMELVEGRDG